MGNKTYDELQGMTTVEVIAAFITETQAPLSLAGGGAIDSWHETRKRLGLNGWHTYEEAVAGLRAALATPTTDHTPDPEDTDEHV